MPLRFLPKQKLALATAIYWFLLLYIIAALFFWYIKLQQQNQQMANYKLMELVADDPSYLRKVDQINLEAGRKTMQFRGEGLTFLVFILIGAVFVFRAVRRQFRVAQQQQNFMMAITHELKTPIAVAKLNLETLKKHRLDEQKQQKLIQMTLEETNRLNTLTNNILISSQLEGGGYKLVREEIDLSLTGEKLMEEYRQRFPGRHFEWQIEPDIDISGDPLLLQIMISNLVDNALKYSPKESPVRFRLYRSQGAIIIEVKDNGAGIPDDEKQKVFQRFYRIGNELVRKTKGTGLGLYLCKKIVTDHRGTIRVTDNQPAGSIFTIQFPLQK
ncbi:sensor histidine kinase [Flavihumibacter stibioxidans]|uniref:histidine kinase n=1 Tax=Flavihumibacter stibioxidans TaxID=1834163 RepID=A0ABR7M7W1_9BACT|nr:ATP-binding protein [Flavihumibacter stibioxidans]MBC6491135.1 two-component sensor histidine kinase [Flavihumibacter stibioxidans]